MGFTGDSRNRRLKQLSPWRALAAWLGERARAWSSARQGVDPQTVRLASRRVYILPTRSGVTFSIIVFTMLLGSMNYNNNMGLALTFLLVSVAIISIYQCHRNLVGVRVQFRGVRPVFAGDPLQFRLTLENGCNQARWQLHLAWDGESGYCADLGRRDHAEVVLALPTRTRGSIRAPRLRLETRFPLGLVRAWAWIDMELHGIAYPRPVEHASIPPGGAGREPVAGLTGEGLDDFVALRDYRSGDPPGRIAWKALARSGDMLVKEYRSGTLPLRWLDWNLLPPVDTETRLALLARLVLDARAAHTVFGLRIPGHEIAPSDGDPQMHRCLRCLAGFNQPVPAVAPA